MSTHRFFFFYPQKYSRNQFVFIITLWTNSHELAVDQILTFHMVCRSIHPVAPCHVCTATWEGNSEELARFDFPMETRQRFFLNLLSATNRKRNFFSIIVF